MKLNINRKKLRFGSLAVILTAFIIAAVVLLNVLFLALATNYRWYIDMTSESLFTLSDKCRDLLIESINGENGANAQRRAYNEKNGLKEGDADFKPDVRVKIYFCDDPDNLQENTYMRYAYTTVQEMRDACGFIDIDYLNWEYNPTSVQKFQKTGAGINSQSIIVESGTEYRVFKLESLFTMNDAGEIWAYNGEKKLAGAILAVSSIDQPVAYITTSHSEAFYDTALLELLSDAGYKIQIEGATDADGKVVVPRLDDKQANPLDNEDVRLVVIYNPRSDFQTAGTANELDRLNRFLEKNNSMMVFTDPNSPVLPDFEEWLAVQWGIVYDRYKVGDKTYSYMLKDSSSSLDNAGYTLRAVYDTEGGLGNALYKSWLENGEKPNVYFEDVMSISYAPSFNMRRASSDDDGSKDFDYGGYYIDGVSKEIYNVFTAPTSAVAIANGAQVATGVGTSGTAGGVTYIFTDSDKKVYTIKDDKIFDEAGVELSFNSNGNYQTAAGTELKVQDGKIVTASGTAPEMKLLITELIEYGMVNGKKTDLVYKLNASGTAILDPNGVELQKDENENYTTASGSKLAIESIDGRPSIKVVSGSTETASPFHLMTISRRSNDVRETNYQSTSQDAYVLACGSTKFATKEYLESAVYGNKDVLLSATVQMGRDTVPVGIDFKPFASFEISDITDAEANSYTWLLTLVPSVIIIGVGVFVLIRRKYS